MSLGTTATTATYGTRRRTDITATAVDPLIEPFALIHLNYREAVARQVAGLTDEELNQVLVLFTHTNLINIPSEFWPVAGKVRHFIQAEQKRRAAREANLETLTGEPTA